MTDIWIPKKRNTNYDPCPEGIPDHIYAEAKSAKKFYNEEWEFWVYQVSKDHNCSVAKAEDACIRGLQKTIFRIQFIYGDKIAKWYEEYLDLGDIFNKVNHPTYLKQLGE